MSMAEKLLIRNLEMKIKELSSLNEKYKAKITYLENTFNNLKSQIQNLEIMRQDFKTREKIFEKEKLEIERKNQKILQLEEDIVNLKLEHEKYKHEKDLKYEHDVYTIKNLYDTKQLKESTSKVVENVNKKYYEEIIKLQNTIHDIREEQRKNDEMKELDFENRMNDMKRKMLNYIKDAQTSKQYLSNEQLRLNDKLSIVHKNTLLYELDFQSTQLEDLLKQRKHLDKIITGMKSDIEIHKKIEKILTHKNKQYTDMIKVLSTKIESKEKDCENQNENGEKDNNNHIEKNNTMHILPKFKNIKFKYSKSNENNIIHIMNKKTIFNKRNDSLIKTESYLNDVNNTPNKNKKYRKIYSYFSKTNRSIDEVENNKDKDTINLTKELTKRIKESEDYKSKYECYKTKLDLINFKYGNIMNLFDEVLTKIYEDKNMAYLKNIYIDLEDFKSCNFEQLSSKQKYSIVILMINYLLPLINPNQLPEKFKNLISNIENVTFINDKSNYLLNNTTYRKINNYTNRNSEHKYKLIKSRNRSMNDFGKTENLLDNNSNTYYKQINGFTNNSNSYHKNENLPKNKTIINKNFLKFINSQGNKKEFGKNSLPFKYNSLLYNFFKSLEGDNNNNNPEFKKSYSLFNI